jgi:hypothetical protein
MLLLLGILGSVAWSQSAQSPQIEQMIVSNVMGIVFQSEAGTDYELEFTTNMQGQTWRSGKFTAHGDGTVLTVFDPTGPNDKKFYRLTAIGPGVPDSGLSFDADTGEITLPFDVSGGVVSQPDDSGTTTPTSGGKAGYVFAVTDAGDYRVKMMVDAPHAGSDSFYVNIDAEPASGNYMTWDIIPLTSGFEERTVSWRGNGTFSAPEFPEKEFTLSAGNHELIVRGREGGTKVDSIVVEKVEAGSIDAT